MSDHIIEPSNYLQPFKGRGISLYSITSSLFPQEIYLFFANYYIETDVGLVFKSIETNQSFIFVQQTVTPFFSGENQLMKFQFQSNQNVYLVAKNTVKISGPVSKNSLSSLLKKTQCQKSQKQKTIKHATKQNEKDILQNRKIKKNSNLSELQIINLALSPNQLSMQQNSFCSQKQENININQLSYNMFNDSRKPNYLQFGINRVIESAKDYFQKTYQIIKYKFMNYFVHAFFPKAKNMVHKFKLVNEGVLKIQDHLDIMYILNKLLEIDTIKYILLKNKDQLKLFEYIPKPVISDETLDSNQDSFTSLESDAVKNKIINEGISENEIQSEINTFQIQKIAQRNQSTSPQIQGSNQSQQIIVQNSPNPNKAQYRIVRRKSIAVSLHKNLYYQFGKKKTEQQIIQQAFDGLSNILQQRKFSKIDEKLIELIDHNLIPQIQKEQQLFEQKEEQLTQIPLNACLSNCIQKPFNHDRQELKKSMIPLNKLHVIKDSSFNQTSSFYTNSRNPKDILYEGIQEFDIPNKVKKSLKENQNQVVNSGKKLGQENYNFQEQLTSSEETNQICPSLKENDNSAIDIQLVYQSPTMKQIFSKQLLQIMNSFILTFENALKQVDMYGQNIQVNLNKKNRYNTVFGGILSTLIFKLLLVGCWFFGKEQIYKLNPQVIIQVRFVDSPRRIDIRPDNLILMLGVANHNSQYFKDPTIFTVNAFQQIQVNYIDPDTGKSTIKLQNQNITMRLCNKNDVGISNTESYFSSFNIPALHCFDTSTQPVYFEGDFNQKSFSQIFVYFEKCKKSTSSVVICKPKEVIDKTLLLSKVGIFMSDQVVDPLNFKNPISTRGIGLFASTSSNLPQEIGLYYTNQYIDTDAGIFYSEFDPNALARILIRLQKQKENYMKRTYLKFAEVVAQVGGLLKILILLEFILSNPISKLCYFKAIIDEIYQFQSTDNKVNLIPKDKQKFELSKKEIIDKQSQLAQIYDQQKKQIIKNKLKNKNFDLDLSKFSSQKQPQNSPQQTDQQNSYSFNLMNFQQTKKPESESNNCAIIDNIINKTKQYFQSTHNMLKYSFTQYLSYALTKSKIFSSQNILFEQGIEKIQENVDILYIFNKLFEIDKIKQILFNSDQLKLFEYMPKPVISDKKRLGDESQIQNLENDDDNDDEKKNQPKITEDKKVSKKNKSTARSINRRLKQENQLSEQAQEGLKNILKLNKMSKIDENLTKIIDPSIIKQIKKYKYNCFTNSEENDSTFQMIKSNTNIMQKSIGSFKKVQEQFQYLENKQKTLQSGFLQYKQYKEILKDLNLNDLSNQKNQSQNGENECKKDNDYYEQTIEDNQIYFVDQGDNSYQTSIQSLYSSVVKQQNYIPNKKKK
ncbi:hypothetical protein ABPG72_005427 [Tetrahymena utriculariae]